TYSPTWRHSQRDSTRPGHHPSQQHIRPGIALRRPAINPGSPRPEFCVALHQAIGAVGVAIRIVFRHPAKTPLLLATLARLRLVVVDTTQPRRRSIRQRIVLGDFHWHLSVPLDRFG